MKKTITLCLFILTLFNQLSAQIDGWINSRNPLLFEKLYLHVDRELYAVGDRIWLKAYEVNGITNQLNSNLRNIFVQLVAEDGHVAKDILLFSAKGQAIGDFKTDSLPSGMYTIRAFTKYLKNFGEEAYFHKKIWISKTFNSAAIAVKDTSGNPKIELTFLPEGGNMVLNAVNTVAFKAIDSKGHGIYVTGRIMDDLGDTIVTFSTSYRGMGKLMMMPVDDRTYYATIDKHPGMKVEIPKAISGGIGLNYKDLGEFLQFTLSSNMNVDDQPPFYFMASHKGTIVYKKIEMYDYTQTVTLDKKLFPNGISKITLLDTLMNPFAERLIFVDDEKPDLIKLQTNKQEYIPREKVTIDAEALLEPGDSIQSTLSVAVVNKSYFVPDGNSQNIKSYLLLDSELKGAIESPASYFVNDRFHTSAEKLDLLMLVNGWRSYFWDDIEANKTVNQEDWNDVGINIQGHVKKLLWNGPQAEAEVKMDYVFKNFQLGKTITDKNGRFNFDRIFYYDSAKVMLNAITKGGTRNLEIMLDPDQDKDSVVSVDLLRKACFDVGPNGAFIRDNSFRRQRELEFSPEKGAILLEGVDVIAQSALNRSWGAYPQADKTLKIDKKDYRFGSLIRYLQDTLTGLTDYADGTMFRNKSLSFMIDGADCTKDEFLRCRICDVDFVDLAIVPVVYTTPNSMTGKQYFSSERAIIAIYRKPFAIRTNYSIYDYVKGRAIIRTKGFHQAIKFYSPQYTLENINNKKPDYRPTLFWNPDLQFENGKANINFFTSDEKADYVVFVEGISKNGQICYGTTSFSVK